MSYHYLVVKDLDRKEQTKPHYSLITIGSGTSLAEIDLFTSKFTKEELKDYLRGIGINIYEEGVKQQIFIVSSGKGDVRYRDVVYEDRDLHELARKELAGERINNQDVCNSVSQKAIENSDFKKLLNAKFFDMYEELRLRILDAANKKTGRVSFVGDAWLQNNYLVGRDCLCSFYEYEKSKGFIKDKGLSALLRRKTFFVEDRKSIHEELKTVLKEGADQYSLFASPEEASQIAIEESIEPKQIEQEESVFEENKDEFVSSKKGLPLDIKNTEPDPTALEYVIGFIINLNYYYSKEDNEYYANFDELAKKRKISLTEDDCHLLNRLLSKELRKKAALANIHANHIKEYYSPGEAEDVNAYRSEIKRILKKSCLEEKTPEYKNAYHVFLFIDKLTKGKEDNYGKQY